MIALPLHTEVLIVGAGPSGLMMAAQLLRHGVVPVIIDSKPGPTNQSKALAVQARSLEIYRQMGLIDRVINGGKPAAGVSFSMEGEPVAALPWSKIDNPGTLFPFIHFYPQSQNERLLLDYLTTNCCPVYWQIALISLTQTADGATAQLQTGDNLHTLACTYVVGADGAHSVVRKQLGIFFSGETYLHKFYLADVQIESKFHNDYVQLFLTRKDFAGFFPMPAEQSFRIVASVPEEFEHKEHLQLEDILPHLQKLTGTVIKVLQNNWFTLYKLHHRMADKFRDGRCFLVGDAAHIHSPVGGQGMNTGLQDAYNLAWKIAGVVTGQLGPAILNSFAQERMPVAKELLNTTDKVFNIITSGSLFSNLLKRFVMPRGLKYMWSKSKLRTLFFKRVSQTGLNYRDSKINLQLGTATKVKAGDRLPYLDIFDEKKQTLTDLHAWCSKPGFTLITMGEIQESYLFALAKWITQSYPVGLNFFHLPPSARNQPVFDKFEIRPGHRKALIIRPDMYIGYSNDIVDIEMMNNYLRDVVGFRAI